MPNWSDIDDSQIARLLCVGFDGISPTPDLRHLIAKGVRSVIFFKRNIQSPAQFADLTAQIKNLSPAPLLTCIDQEGGRVQRLRDGFSILPSLREIGKSPDPEKLAQKVGSVLAAELRSVNIDLDFAPVVDVDTNPDNPVIADRSFSTNPQVVARLGAQMILALQQAGVAACAKHFPGHGDTSVDSHKNLPTLPHSLERLRSIELPPFRSAIESNVASIMTAHVLFESLDKDFPSTMSAPVLSLLRDEMHFEGVIISDDLEMKAIADFYGFEQAVIRAINAGVDLLLICHTPALQHQAIDVLTSAVKSGQIPRSRIQSANQRLDALFQKFVKPPKTYSPPSTIPTPLISKTEDSPDPTEWKQ